MPAPAVRLRSTVLAAALAALVLILGAPAGAGPLAAAGPVAGSVQQAYHAGSATQPSRTATGYTGPWLTLQATSVGAPGMEPTIGVAADGTVYYGAAHIVFDTPITWGGARTDTRMSTDGGQTFTSIQNGLGDPASVPPANADPMIYVDPTTGRVFNFDLEGACNFLNYSDDRGKTWTTNPVACGNLVVDHQTIVTGRPPGNLTTSGYPNVVYWCSNRVADSTCGRSLDGGITWTPTGQSAYTGFDPAAGGLCGGLTGHLATDPDGRIFLPKGHCSHPWVAISDDGGTTWTRVQVSDLRASSTHLSVASDNAGNLYYGWWGGPTSADRLPYLAISRDHGLHWSKPMMIAPPGVKAADLVTVTAGGVGRVAVTFLSSTADSSSTRPLDQTVVVSKNALTKSPLFLSATANPAGDPVHRGNCNGRCGGIWDFFDIQISKTGQLWASMSDDCVDACVTEGKATALHAGNGYAVTQIGGPNLGSPFQFYRP